MFRSFFDIYMSIYIYIYLYIFLYIYRKKNGTFSRSFAKEWNVLAFFSVLCKRTLRSLRSFPFFAKECCILFRSLEKNRKERNVLLGLISCQKLEKRTEKNGTFFFTEKNVRYQTEKNGTNEMTHILAKYSKWNELENYTFWQKHF